MIGKWHGFVSIDERASYPWFKSILSGRYGSNCALDSNAYSVGFRCRINIRRLYHGFILYQHPMPSLIARYRRDESS